MVLRLTERPVTSLSQTQESRLDAMIFNTEIVAVALQPDGIQIELPASTFHINRIKDYYGAIGNNCDFVTPVTLQHTAPRLTMWVDEDARLYTPRTPVNQFASIIMASFTHHTVDIVGTVIYTGAVGNRIHPLPPVYLAQLREIEKQRQVIQP